MKIYARFADVQYIIEYDKCNFKMSIMGLRADCEGKEYHLTNTFTGENKMKNSHGVGKLFFELCSKAKKIGADVIIDNIERNSEGIPHIAIINDPNEYVNN